MVGAYTAILGESGLRKSEGLRLRWQDIDLTGRPTVTQSKSGRPRYVPLSTYALEWFLQLPRWPGQPWVFLSRFGSPLRKPRNTFDKGKKAAGLNWVRGFHDLRHFRATMWLQHGIDVDTVQRYLGHHRIETTMRYLHFVEDYAERAVRKAQAQELREAQELGSGGRQRVSRNQGPRAKIPVNRWCERGDSNSHAREGTRS